MSETESPLSHLLSAAREGDEAARSRVLARYQAWVRLLARMQIDSSFRGKFDPSDIAQQTMLEACRALGKFRGTTEAELLAWLRQILAHVFLHEVRRYRGTQRRDVGREVSLAQTLAESSLRLDALLAGTGPTPSQEVSAREQVVLLADALARLPADYREVLVLRNLEDLPHEEVARRMGRSVGAVRMLWARALARLKAEIDP